MFTLLLVVAWLLLLLVVVWDCVLRVAACGCVYLPLLVVVVV